MKAASARSLRARVRAAVTSSLWLIPAVCVALAMGLAKLLVYVDRGIDQRSNRWFLFGGQADSAREMLATIANSLMTFTGVVFSITILVLQLASSQFSPRVLRTFLEDRFTHVSLGVFVGSFVYAMAVLPEVRGASPQGGAEFVPGLAVFVAFLLVLASVAVFIRYLHNMAHAIRAVHIIRRVASDARVAMNELFPDRHRANGDQPIIERPTGPGRVLSSGDQAGVVSAVDDTSLVEIATSRDVTIELLAGVGDFVPRDSPLFRVWGEAECPADELRRLVFIADERTPEQDPGFGFRQLVDIAERALSPGVNDPTTAVQAIDQLHDLLRGLANRRFPEPGRWDGHGRLRVIVPRLDWDGYVHLAFDEIRQSGRGSLHVARRLRAALSDLLSVAPLSRRAALEQQRRLLEDAVEHAFDVKGERRLAQSSDRQDA